MAGNSNYVLAEDLLDLQNRLDWLDEERRKANRKVAELEQSFALQEREIQEREQRIQELERQIANTNAQLGRIPQVDTRLSQFKDEMVDMIEQYDKRRIQSEEDLDRLRRVEHENTARELADIRKELPAISRLQQDMELRQAEESRLANLIGTQKSRISALNNQVEEWGRAQTFLEEKEKQDSRNISDLQNNIFEINKRWAPINERIDVSNGNLMRLEAAIQPLINLRDELNQQMKGWMEQIQIGEHERNKQQESWRQLLDENASTLDRFKKEWVTFSDQYKEAQMAVQTLTDWQQQLEQQQRESSELIRIESHRMQSRWDNFQQEVARQLKSFEMEGEQRWHGVDRQNSQVQEKFAALDEILEQLQQDKDLVWRIQSAQSDAIKKLPLIWLEEVEKARAQDPNRRRQPTLVPVREE